MIKHLQNQKMALGELLPILQNDALEYIDIIQPAKKFTFAGLDHVINHVGIAYTLQTTAQQQICVKLKIPYTYLKRCNPELQAKNLNTWFNTIPEKKYLWRTDGFDIRAIFTERYKPINHIDIIKNLIKIKGEYTQVFVYYTEQLLAIQLPNETQSFQIADDTFHTGLSIINSETGQYQFQIENYILRLICTNGLIVPIHVNGFKKRHLIKNFTKNFQLDEIIQTTQNMSETYITELAKTRHIKLKEPIKTIERINNRFHLTTLEQEAAIWGYNQEPGNTIYHVVNGYTRGAQYEKISPNSAIKLQRVGGHVAGFTHKEMK